MKAVLKHNVVQKAKVGIDSGRILTTQPIIILKNQFGRHNTNRNIIKVEKIK
ncbi:MAG TPA: hypothetical protein VIH90_03385 [Candidatus Saccharimonadales bacterium]